jgi:thiol-disulfide isomerase/thioredoxin
MALGEPLSVGPAQRKLQIAALAGKPGFALPDLAGTLQDLPSHAGGVVLVHFFATWCEPCREELSSLSRLAQGPEGHLLSVVAVDVAEVPARVRHFIDATPVSFPILLDTDRSVTKAWDVTILPTTFVLDRGLVRLFVEGDVDWSRPDILAELRRVAAEAPRPKNEN